MTHFAGLLLCFVYLTELLLALSHDIEVNPGPRPPKFPCGSCGKAVRNGQNAIHCESCDQWYHIECEGLGAEVLQVLCEHDSYSWICLNCGLPNFSTGLFDETLSSLHTSNSFESLDPSHCQVSSTPLKPNDHQNRPTTLTPKKLKILNVNFQSVVNKVPDLQCLIDTETPDIIVGTESWLSIDIRDSEIFPPGYTPYRADRVSKTTRSGGVFVLVRDTLICYEQPQLRSECEITWVKLEIVGAQPLYLAAYYKPSEDDQDSLDMLRNSLEKLNGKKGNIMVVGDFNLPKFTWTDCEPSIRPDSSGGSVYDSFVDILDDFNLVQIVTEPTREDNILDLILTLP